MKKRMIFLALLLLTVMTASAQQYTRATWWNTPPDEWQFFAGVDVAFPEQKPKNMAYGINVGYVKTWGVYAHVLLNKSPLGEKEVDYSYDSSPGYNYYLSGKYRHAYRAFMGGGMLRLWSPVYLHIGAGYVKNQVVYEHMDGSYILWEPYNKDKDHDDFDGLGFEAGLSLRVNNLFIHGNGIRAGDSIALSFGLSYCF